MKFRLGQRIKPLASMMVVLAALFVMSGVAFARELTAFDDAAFRKAQNEGKTIVLDFHAVWCGVCKKQQPVLMGLLDGPEFKDVVAYAVDYDWAEDLNREYNVTNQATLVILKGKTEKARATGMTDRDEMKVLLLKGA